jgi:hypothetical protein
MRSLVRIIPWTALFLILPLGAMVAHLSCNQTSGEKATFQTGVTGGLSTGDAVAPFTNARGWTVTLTEAYVAVGPIYFYSSPPQTAMIERLLGDGTARACPTHAQYDKGEVLGEVLEQYAVDLLSGEVVDTGLRYGVAGTAQMFEVHLHPPGEVTPASPTSSFEPLGGHSIWVAGTATQDGSEVAFEGALTIPDEGTLRIVTSIPADVELADVAKQPGRAVVKVHLDEWFHNVGFDGLTQEGSSGRMVLDEDSQAYQALLVGVRSRTSYSLSWRNP